MNEPTPAPTPKPVVWDIESTHPDLVEPLKQAMREVLDPEIGMSIIQLGLVRNVSVNEDSLVVSMIMTTPFCPYAPTLLEQTKQKAGIRFPTSGCSRTRNGTLGFLHDGRPNCF